MTTIASIIGLPNEDQRVRFCTHFSISQNLDEHGIKGIFYDGKFWSHDMADHWAPHEITNWRPA